MSHQTRILTKYKFLPLISTVIITTQTSHIHWAVKGQMGVELLGKIVNFGWRKSLPVAFLSFQPALAPPGLVLVSHPVKSNSINMHFTYFFKSRVCVCACTHTYSCRLSVQSCLCSCALEGSK